MNNIFFICKSLRKIGSIINIKSFATLSHYLCTKIIEKKIKNIDYDHYNYDLEEKSIRPIIWVYWHQEVLPEVVANCREKLLENANDNFEVIFLNKNNLNDYFSPPEFIVNKLNSGAITLTHFSDIIRFYLLFEYGGYWFDSTVMTLTDLKGVLNDKVFFTLKHTNYSIYHSQTSGQWTSYCIGTYKGSPLAKFMYDSFINYWENNDSLIDYHLVDYLMLLAYKKISSVQKIIKYQDHYVGENRWLLQDNYDVKISAEIDSRIKNDLYKIYKLSYKVNAINPEYTYYKKYFLLK